MTERNLLRHCLCRLLGNFWNAESECWKPGFYVTSFYILFISLFTGSKSEVSIRLSCLFKCTWSRPLTVCIYVSLYQRFRIENTCLTECVFAAIFMCLGNRLPKLSSNVPTNDTALKTIRVFAYECNLKYGTAFQLRQCELSGALVNFISGILITNKNKRFSATPWSAHILIIWQRNSNKDEESTYKDNRMFFLRLCWCCAAKSSKWNHTNSSKCLHFYRTHGLCLYVHGFKFIFGSRSKLFSSRPINSLVLRINNEAVTDARYHTAVRSFATSSIYLLVR